MKRLLWSVVPALVVLAGILVQDFRNLDPNAWVVDSAYKLCRELSSDSDGNAVTPSVAKPSGVGAVSSSGELASPKPSSLVIDAEPEIVSFIRQLLRRRGYDLFGLPDSRATLSTFRSTGSLSPGSPAAAPFRPGHRGFLEGSRSHSRSYLPDSRTETTLAIDLMPRD